MTMFVEVTCIKFHYVTFNDVMLEYVRFNDVTLDDVTLNDAVLRTSSVSLTRRICSRRSCRSLKVLCAVMEYTSRKPCPFFMYRSLIAVNCSCKSKSTIQQLLKSSLVHQLSRNLLCVT